MTPFTIELEDRLRYSPAVRGLLAGWKSFRVRNPGSDPQQIAAAIDKLCGAARLAADRGQLLRIEERISELVRRLNGATFDWRPFEESAAKRRIENAVVLKPYISEREKGVVYISFEYQWIRLLQNCDIKEFARRYQLVLSPVWAVPHGLVNYVLPAIWPGKVFCHLSDPNDAEILPRMSANYVVVPLLCSSWVHPDLYRPVPYEKKDIDIVMLANFGKYKRHHVLFRALRDMPRSTRVVLIGQHNGARTADVLRAEARAYGVEDRFELKVSPPDAEMLDALARARTSLILSRREGSCVAIVESIFANTPAALLEGAEVGSRQFINPSTGRFLREQNLAADLMDFIAESQRYTPREWALQNKISCFGSSATLNRVVRDHCLKDGQEWTQDLAEFHWRPNPTLIHEADRPRMASSYQDIEDRFGISLGRPPAAPGN
ncbi:MAG: glycosyltransferase [Verrucomicrobiota bacterium]